MSLIEVMIVIAIIAMVSGGVAVVAIGQADTARRKHAASSARTLRTAVQTYWMAESTRECPSIQELASAQIVDEGQSLIDPWDQAWKIECDGVRVAVGSSGPDKLWGTEDDIFIPRSFEADEP